MSAQDRTLDQYQQFMRINAAASLFRLAREMGVLGKLREGQRTLEQLCEKLSLRGEPAKLMMDALVATNIIEQYEEDYALCGQQADMPYASTNRVLKILEERKLGRALSQREANRVVKANQRQLLRREGVTVKSGEVKSEECAAA